ncbi:hypothetical protein [Halobacteriovorax sp. JY17]|uniref:hypothetical protein n=1 Tax=Halobacteriovorax sp. JY17 TaxID=2014617 RepID=UPI000C3AB072|nr:hypothetical protein [Halobacteriovorax sp. JY17]PIK15184.1 MAG: hypothetical protein CES88_00295 [Halobacteriovorax sp. JY17]
MKNFIKGNREEYLASDDLHQLVNLDEDLFEVFKAQRLDDLVNERVRSEYKSPLDKIAHLEAIVEFKMKYPSLSGFQDNHRKLTEKMLKKLTKALDGVDFNSDWTLSKYRRFIFKYYSIMNTHREVPLNFDSFKVATRDFIIKRTEQQILMNHVAPNISVVSKWKNRTKLILSLLSNITMIHNVGTFYTFYELRMFTPSDELIEKIYQQGILPNLDELMAKYRLLGGAELTYNELRPYLVVTGLATTAIAIINAYQNGEHIIENTAKEYQDVVYRIIGMFSSSMSEAQKSSLVHKFEKEAKNSSAENQEFYTSVIEILTK